MSENTGKELTDVEAQLAASIAKSKQRIGAPPSNKIQASNKIFTLPTGESNTSLSVIVLDWRHVLAKYPGVYQAGKPQNPVCFAVGEEDPESGALKPHADSPEPKDENCKVCPHNQWGSSPTGGGKDCKNKARLMLTSEGCDQDTRPLKLYVPSTTLKAWFEYIADLAKEGLDIAQVVTEITFDPNTTYNKFQFKKVKQHSNVANALALKAKYQDFVAQTIEMRDS